MTQPRVKHNKRKDGKDLEETGVQELYRSIQPRTFDDIIGQGPIVGALKKDVVDGSSTCSVPFLLVYNGSGKNISRHSFSLKP